MLCCVQSGETALHWAALDGYADIVQLLVDYGAAVDLGRDKVTNHDYLLTCGWSFGCGFINIHIPIRAGSVCDDIAWFLIPAVWKYHH